ncbi:hypothetical protein ACPPVT_18360 [Angustibacter sp. McL0619]|uniref:hypothetical protein n=1 Tax=Angustibacter sp. McL0619 TaxID=3415676 RepID=UPI003CF2FD95
MVPDRLHDALDSLRDDVEQVGLPGAGAARTRGDRRQRRRTAAGAVTAVAAVAVLAVGVGLAQGPGRPRTTPLATSSTASQAATTANPTPSAPTSGSPSPIATARPVITVRPSGVGHVPAAYFLPGQLWRGPDLDHGRPIESIALKEQEGTTQYFDCDPDVQLTGDVAVVQAQERAGLFVGTQKVRLLRSPAAAKTFAMQLAADLPGCQGRMRSAARTQAGTLPAGETAPVPNASVVEDHDGRVDDATGSVRVYRTTTDFGTPSSSKSIEWVVLAREGDAVSSIALRKLEGSQVSFATMRRLGGEAREQLRWAAEQ